MAAKLRVAPITATSIPRLELMGAVTRERLSTRIAKVLELQTSQLMFWSDSRNALWWIRGHSRNFKPFVANRVGEIQTSTNPEQWRHVPTTLNPADILSRGMKTADLLECVRWWTGPDFLKQSEAAWPTKTIDGIHTGYDEMKRPARLQLDKSTPEDIAKNSSKYIYFTINTEEMEFPINPCNYSSLLRLKRMLAG